MAILSNDTGLIKKNTGSSSTFLTKLLLTDLIGLFSCIAAGIDAVTHHKAGLI